MIEIYIILFVFVYITIQILISTNTSNCNNFELYKNKATPCKCRGGLYMSQSDSERSKICRDYSTTKEGNIDMMNYECNIGDKGRKSDKFVFTPYIDDNWKPNYPNNLNNNICKNI